jgi:hypothetical protein
VFEITAFAATLGARHQIVQVAAHHEGLIRFADVTPCATLASRRRAADESQDMDNGDLRHRFSPFLFTGTVAKIRPRRRCSRPFSISLNLSQEYRSADQ